MRVAAGALAKQLLEQFGIKTLGYVVELGGTKIEAQVGNIEQHKKLRDQSEIYSLNPAQDAQFKEMIDACGKDGDTLGGIIEARVEGLPFGLGSHTQWDRKLDGRLAQAVMSIQAIKGVEIGLGFEAARRRGSKVHDPIQYDQFQRDTPSLGFVRSHEQCRGTRSRHDEWTAAYCTGGEKTD